MSFLDLELVQNRRVEVSKDAKLRHQERLYVDGELTQLCVRCAKETFRGDGKPREGKVAQTSKQLFGEDFEREVTVTIVETMDWKN
jgi:hypothetical protein